MTDSFKVQIRWCKRQDKAKYKLAQNKQAEKQKSKKSKKQKSKNKKAIMNKIKKKEKPSSKWGNVDRRT